MKNAYSIRRKKKKGTKKSKIAKIISSINIGCCCFLACSKNKGWYMFSQMYIVVDVCLKNKAYSQDISCEIDGKSFYALSYFPSFPPFGVSIVLVCVLYLQHLSLRTVRSFLFDWRQHGNHFRINVYYFTFN